MQFLRRDGSALWVELRASRSQYHGRPAVLGLVRDITERRRSEQALREASELLQAVEDSVLDHMAVLDRDGVIVNVNAGWTAFAPATAARDGLPRAHRRRRRLPRSLPQRLVGPGDQR